MRLNPNCSETIWRLQVKRKMEKDDRVNIVNAFENKMENEEEEHSSSGMRDCFETLLYLLEKAKKERKDIDSAIVEITEISGANSVDPEFALNIAQRVVKGKITKEEGMEECGGDYG